MHHFKQSVLLLHVQLKQDTCRQRKRSGSCNGHVLCPAEAAVQSQNLGALPVAAEEKPGVSQGVYCISPFIWSDIAVFRA